MTEKNKTKWTKYLTYALYVLIVMNFSTGITHLIAQIGISVDLLVQAVIHGVYWKQNAGQLDEDEAAAEKKSVRIFLIAAIVWTAYVVFVPLLVPYF